MHSPRSTPVAVVALAVAATLTFACRPEQGTPRGDERAERALELSQDLPERLDGDLQSWLAWIRDEMVPGIGTDEAERLLWTVPNAGASTAELGKLWLALRAIERRADRDTFFRRAGRPLDDLPAIDFVTVPAGSFRMGSPPEERGRTGSEEPMREVEVSTFLLSATQVTNAQYEHFDARHAREDWGRLTFDELDDHPVVNVSWWDAFVYSLWIDGRLPSEAEWEYAARAGTTTRFSSGDSAADLARVGWFFDNSEQRTHTAATLEPNAFGLFDMHGNVFEWCRNPWRERYPEPGRSTETRDHEQSSLRVYRGGAWNRYAEYARSAYRGGWPATERNTYLGFRIARDVTP